jgi:beta-galactosidase
VVGRAAAGAANRFQARFEATFDPGEIVAVAYRDGHEAERTSLRSARGDVCVDVAVDRSELRADGTDLAYVTITLVDADGNLYTTADREMSVVLDGPGVLQGFGSAAPRSEETFAGDRHTTFDGRAIAVVRPTGAGTITITVSADGCGARSVSFTANGRVPS